MQHNLQKWSQPIRKQKDAVHRVQNIENALHWILELFFSELAKLFDVSCEAPCTCVRSQDQDSPVPLGCWMEPICLALSC